MTKRQSLKPIALKDVVVYAKRPTNLVTDWTFTFKVNKRYKRDYYQFKLIKGKPYFRELDSGKAIHKHWLKVRNRLLIPQTLEAIHKRHIYLNWHAVINSL